MKIRALRCLVCGSITGLMNKSCEECDGEKFEEIQYEPEDSNEPGYVVTVVRKITSMEEGLTWHRSLLENLKPYNIWYDGHEVEIFKAVEDAVMLSAGEFTMYWNFAVGDASKTVELIANLSKLRPGLMEAAVIEMDYHDTVELE